jgi:hypothetical protein
MVGVAAECALLVWIRLLDQAVAVRADQARNDAVHQHRRDRISPLFVLPPANSLAQGAGNQRGRLRALFSLSNEFQDDCRALTAARFSKTDQRLVKKQRTIWPGPRLNKGPPT